MKSSIKNIPLASLSLLLFLNEIKNIYFFLSLSYAETIIDFIQYPLYVLLILIIIRSKYRTKEFFVIILLGAALLIGVLFSHSMYFFRGFLLIIAVREVPFSKIVKNIKTTYILVLLFGCLLFALGLSNNGYTNRWGVTLGFQTPNKTGQIIIVICLCYLFEIYNSFKLKNLIFYECIACLSWAVLASRGTAITIAMIPIIIPISKFVYSKQWKIGRYFMLFSQLIIICLSYLFSRIIEFSLIIQKIDAILSNRLIYSYIALQNYGIQLFGQNVQLLSKAEYYDAIFQRHRNFLTIDNSYIFSLIVMGLIPTAIFALGYYLSVKKGLHNKNYIVVVTAILLAVYGIAEGDMVEIYKNFIYLYIFSLDDYSLAFEGGRNENFINSRNFKS